MRPADVDWYPFGPAGGGSRRYRCELPADILQKQGINSRIEPSSRGKVAGISVLQKRFKRLDRQIVTQARSGGSHIVFDLCDNYLYSGIYSPRLWLRAAAVRRMMAGADSLTVSTQWLAEALHPLECQVLPDLVDLGARRKPCVQRSGEYFELLWFGNAGSEMPAFGMRDLLPLLPILERLSAELPLRLTVLSNNQRMASQILSGLRVPWRYLEWAEVDAKRCIAGADVALLPVTANPFTLAKSSNRVQLALWNGTPVIASPLPEYLPFSDCILTENWLENIRLYRDDPQLATEHVEDGQSLILRDFMPETQALRWLDFFRSLL